MRLTVREDSVELEGTQHVVLKTDDSLLAGDGGPAFVKLSAGVSSCGAVVKRTESGAGDIVMDKYLRILLRAGVGDRVEIEPAAFPAAVSLELKVPPEYQRESLKMLIRDLLTGKPVSVGQVVPLLLSDFQKEQPEGEVLATDPAGIVIISPETAIELRPGKVGSGAVTYRDIGGLSREIEKIRQTVEYPIRHPEVFQRLGIVPPRGIILYGPPGTGKTLIARALAHEVGASVHSIQGPEIMSSYHGGSEYNLRQVLDRAKGEAPSMIIIDELDSIAPRRDKMQDGVAQGVVATLLTFMDGLSELKGVMVIGTTNAVNAIDPALRRPGRFEHEIHIGVPDTEGRKEILGIHARRMPLAPDVDQDGICERAYGFVGADIAHLCREAAYCALRRAYGERLTELDQVSDVGSLQVAHEDFERALAAVEPSAMREVTVETPRDVSWDSIGGLQDAKQLIIENIVYGIRRPESFAAVGIMPARGMLLYGPPGTGKTLLAKVVAKEAGANFISVGGPEVRSKWFGESEERIRFIFAKAREVAPCIIFFDEMDSVAPTRGRDASGPTDTIVNQLLSEMDGIRRNESVFVIGATNRSELMDPAILRPGRFDYQVLVPLPDLDARAAIFEIHLRNKPVSEEVRYPDLARSTDGLSGAEIAEICRLATLDALRRNEFDPAGVIVSTDHFAKAMGDVLRTKTELEKPRIGFVMDRGE